MSRLRFAGTTSLLQLRSASRGHARPAQDAAGAIGPVASRSGAIGKNRAIAFDVGPAARRQRIDEPYARAMLRFVHAAVAGRQRVEAFSLGTRLTRVTKELNRDPDQALRQASERVQDWSGGTRLGECLRHFNDEWGFAAWRVARSWWAQ